MNDEIPLFNLYMAVNQQKTVIPVLHYPDSKRQFYYIAVQKIIMMEKV